MKKKNALFVIFWLFNRENFTLGQFSERRFEICSSHLGFD
jgi:hypothetical protein